MHIFYISVTLVGLIGCLDYANANPFQGLLARHKRAAAPCGGTIQWKDEDEIKEKKKIANGGAKECAWHVIGTEICHPQIICPKVEVKGNDEEGLVISDALGGELRLIAKESFTKPKIGSGGGRDLFLDYVASSPGKFECEVSCGNGKGEPLPANGAERKEEFKCVCGLQNKDDRIVGGEDAKLSEFPWQVALVKPGTRQPFCGGAVINNKYILTAAHCFVVPGIEEDGVEILHNAQLLDFTVTNAAASKDIKLGKEGSMQGRGYDQAQKTDADEKTKRWKVAKITNHVVFNENEYDYDVAVVRLENKIDLTADDAPTPICLPKAADYANLYEGAKPWVVGWGLADEKAGATTRLLQKLEVPVLNLEKCKELMPDQGLTTRMICAGYLEGGKDACTGDSGGPLSLKTENKQWVQIGVVSWGDGCAKKDKPGLYSRNTEFIQWIYHHTNQPDVKWCRSTK